MNNRNYGIDLLRLTAMLMIVVLHVIGQGGVMLRISTQPSTYYMIWIPEAAAMCAVNCYGLISGYVGVNASFRPARIVGLWLTVEFYTVFITIVCGIVHPEWINQEIILKSVFPVMWKTYWYFSAYMALAFLAPFFNRMLLSLTQKELRRLMLAIFLIFSIWTLVPKTYDVDFLSLTGGYTFVWIQMLYLLGGCLRLYSMKPVRKRLLLLLYAGMTLLAWGSKILIENHTRKIFGKPMYGRGLVTYHAPTMLICGICLLLVFSQLRFRSGLARGIIAGASPLAFAVYIIHTHPLIWEHVLKDAFSRWAYLDWRVVVFPVLGTALLIFCLCLGIEYLRQRLFSLLKIPAALNRIFSRFG